MKRTPWAGLGALAASLLAVSLTGWLGCGADLPRFPPTAAAPPSAPPRGPGPSRWHPPYAVPRGDARHRPWRHRHYYDYWEPWWYPYPLYDFGYRSWAVGGPPLRIPAPRQAKLDLTLQDPALMRTTNAPLREYLASEKAALNRIARRVNDSLRFMPSDGAGRTGTLVLDIACGLEGGLEEIRVMEDHLGIGYRAILEEAMKEEKWPACPQTLLNVFGTNLLQIRLECRVD